MQRFCRFFFPFAFKIHLHRPVRPQAHRPKYRKSLTREATPRQWCRICTIEGEETKKKENENAGCFSWETIIMMVL